MSLNAVRPGNEKIDLPGLMESRAGTPDPHPLHLRKFTDSQLIQSGPLEKVYCAAAVFDESDISKVETPVKANLICNSVILLKHCKPDIWQPITLPGIPESVFLLSHIIKSSEQLAELEITQF